MFKAQTRRRGTRRAIMLAIAVFALAVTVMSAVISPSVEAGKPGGSTGSTGATLAVKAAATGNLDVIVSGAGFTKGKKVRVDTYGPSPAPLRDVVVSSAGTFLYEYALPGPGTWTFEAYEEARSGWKLKAKTVYTVPD